MAKRRSEIVAASLLSNWTDADTAMQIVGTSLGVFGSGLLEPTTVLSNETPLRNALFDVLLSLVEGGALELRVAPGNRYAFRWRDDIAIAGMAPDGTAAIDLAVPSPYLAELERAQTERDNALVRAESAEALAAEIARPPAAKAAPRRPAAKKPSARKPAPEMERVPAKEPLSARPVAAKAPRRPARVRAAAKKAGVVEPDSAANDVLYLTPPDADEMPDIDLTLEEEQASRRTKWSGYAIDRSRLHLSSVDRLVEDG